MSVSGSDAEGSAIERSKARPIVDGLDQLALRLSEACPARANIHFDYQGLLRVHIDVRSIEDVMAVEAALRALPSVKFGSVLRTTVPGRSFLRRVTAVVDA